MWWIGLLAESNHQYEEHRHDPSSWTYSPKLRLAAICLILVSHGLCRLLPSQFHMLELLTADVDILVDSRKGDISSFALSKCLSLDKSWLALNKPSRASLFIDFIAASAAREEFLPESYQSMLDLTACKSKYLDQRGQNSQPVSHLDVQRVDAVCTFRRAVNSCISGAAFRISTLASLGSINGLQDRHHFVIQQAIEWVPVARECCIGLGRYSVWAFIILRKKTP